MRPLGIPRLLERYRGLSPAVRASLWFTLCNVLQRGTALITVPIFTRLLTTEEYGVCNIYFTWFELFVLFTSLKLPYEGLNNGLIRNEGDKDGYTSAIAGVILTLTAAMALAYLPLRRWIDPITGLNPTLMLLMLVQLLFNPALYLWMNRERFDFHYRWPVLVTLASAILTPVLSVAMVLNTTYRAEARVFGTVLVQGVLGLGCYLLLFARGKRFYVRKYWRFGVTFQLPLLFYYLSQTVLNQSDRLMIQHFAGSGKAGIYSVAYSAATLLLLLVSAVNGSLNPWIYKKLKAGREEELGGAVLSISLMIAAMTVVMAAFAPDLIALLATEAYREAVWIVPPVSAGVFFIYLYMLFANLELYYGENRWVSLISILAALGNVALNWLCIPRWGYLAAGWTTLICYLLLALLHYLLLKRACRKNGQDAPLLPEGKLLGLSIGVAACAFVMLGTYRLGPLRYLVLAAAGAVVCLTRGRWIQAFRQAKNG